MLSNFIFRHPHSLCYCRWKTSRSYLRTSFWLVVFWCHPPYFAHCIKRRSEGTFKHIQQRMKNVMKSLPETSSSEGNLSVLEHTDCKPSLGDYITQINYLTSHELRVFVCWRFVYWFFCFNKINHFYLISENGSNPPVLGNICTIREEEKWSGNVLSYMLAYLITIDIKRSVLALSQKSQLAQEMSTLLFHET